MNTAARTLLLGFAVASAVAGCDEDLLNPMAARQPRVNAYGTSEFYDDGLAMREPPAGTVPRERLTGQPGISTGRIAGATGAGGGPGAEPQYLAAIPIKVDRPLLERGRRRYDITCGTCHGPVGDGDSIVARQMALRPPPSLMLYADRPPGYIFEVITNGFGLMASYAAELSLRDRWAVVAYVRALQLSQAQPLSKAPPEEQQRLQAGKESP